MRDRSNLISNLLNRRESRESYIRSKLSVLIPSQLRALRVKCPMTQQALGEVADMKQSRVSAMERPGEAQFNVDTLVRLAAALKVGLMVKFVSFSEMLRWENSFSQDSFDVIHIEEDTDFIRPVTIADSRIAEATIAVELGSRQTANVSAAIATSLYANPQRPRFRGEREEFYEAISGYPCQSSGAI